MNDINRLDYLFKIYDWAIRYQDDQVFMGLNKYNLKRIKLLVTELKEQENNLAKYLIELEELADEFINHYYAFDKDYFSKLKRLLKKIRKSYSFLIRTRLNFRPRSPYRKYNYTGHQVSYSDHSYSFLCNSGFQYDLFGAKSFPKSIQILCHSFSCFFKTLHNCSSICLEVLKIVEVNRKSPTILKQLYDRDYQEALLAMKAFVNDVSKLNVEFVDFNINPNNNEDLIKYYHFFNRNGWYAYVFKQELNKTINDDFVTYEKKLLSNHSRDEILMLRYVIDNFDNIAYSNRGNTLASDCIVFLMERYNIQSEWKKFYDYFTQRYKGKFIIPTYQAFNKVKNNINLLSNNEDKNRSFSEKLDILLANYSPSSINTNSNSPLPVRVFAAS